MDNRAEATVAALRGGRVCLHPTDTIPGLTFDPTNEAAKSAALEVKKRSGAKNFLALAGDRASAQTYFASMPGNWERVLEALWPGPLSVVWQASPVCPPTLRAPDDSVGIRVPQLATENEWYGEVLQAMGVPLPSTSVNISGQPPATTWPAAVDATKMFGGDVFVPDDVLSEGKNVVPSTLIKLSADGGFTMLREGAVKEASILNALETARES